MRRTWKLLVHCLWHSAVQFYYKSSFLGFFLQVFGWSLGKPSREATDSLQMTGKSLRDTITELSVLQIKVKRISKALTTSTVANENLARDLDLIRFNKWVVYHKGKSSTPTSTRNSQAKQLQGEVAGSCTRHGVTFSRSNTTTHKFPTLPTGFCDSKPPPNVIFLSRFTFTEDTPTPRLQRGK